MMDLLGSDLPIQRDTGMEFSWCDGILLEVGEPNFFLAKLMLYVCNLFY